MPDGRELPALAVAVLVVFAATAALAAPGAAAAGNQATATPSPTSPPTGTATPRPPPPAEEPRNATDRNDTRESQVVKPGPDRGARRRPSAPRVAPEVIVDDDGKAHFRDLSAALEAARPGQTIVVRPGHFDSGGQVDVDNITLVGFGPESTVVGNETASPALVVGNATNVSVRSLAVEGGMAVAGNSSQVSLSSLDVEGEVTIGETRVTDVQIEDATLHGGLTVGSGGSGTVEDVRIVDTELTGTGLRLQGSVSDVRLEDSSVSGADRGVVVHSGEYADVTIHDTDVTDNGVGAVFHDGVDATAFEVHQNAFVDNDVGLRSAAAGTLDAERNTWGARSGPETAGNPSGTGDAVRGDVDVDPWIPAVVRLEDASADSDVLTVNLVAHSERIARYEAVVEFPSESVEAVAVDGRSMPADATVADGEVTISGAGEEPVTGPVVLATITLSGDLQAAAGDLRLVGARSTAFDGTGDALPVAFLTGNLDVEREPDTDTPVARTPTPTETRTPPATTPEPTVTEGPPTVETPPGDEAGGSAPTRTPDKTPTPSMSPDEPTERRSASPPTWRSVTADLPAVGEAVLSRLVAVVQELI